MNSYRFGQEVLGWTRFSAYSDYVLVHPQQVVLKPSNIAWEVAGSLPIPAQTAATALKELRVERGERILIHGASGAAGSLAVQLAHMSGAQVVGTTREVNYGYLLSLGATPVAYGSGMEERLRFHCPDGVDAVLDAHGGAQTAVTSLRLVRDRRRIVTIAIDSISARSGIRTVRAAKSAELLTSMARLASQNVLRLTIRRTYEFGESVTAHSDVESGSATSRVVLLSS